MPENERKDMKKWRWVMLRKIYDKKVMSWSASLPSSFPFLSVCISLPFHLYVSLFFASYVLPLYQYNAHASLSSLHHSLPSLSPSTFCAFLFLLIHFRSLPFLTYGGSRCWWRATPPRKCHVLCWQLSWTWHSYPPAKMGTLSKRHKEATKVRKRKVMVNREVRTKVNGAVRQHSKEGKGKVNIEQRT